MPTPRPDPNEHLPATVRYELAQEAERRRRARLLARKRAAEISDELDSHLDSDDLDRELERDPYEEAEHLLDDGDRREPDEPHYF